MARSTKPRRHRIAPPKKINGHSDGIDVLTREEFLAVRRDMVKQVVDGINSIFNDKRSTTGCLIMMWDINNPSGAVTFGANQPREVSLQVMQKFRERSEKPLDEQLDESAKQ